MTATRGDELRGGDGNDILDGDLGKIDILVGGAGVDFLKGGVVPTLRLRTAERCLQLSTPFLNFESGSAATFWILPTCSPAVTFAGKH